MSNVVWLAIDSAASASIDGMRVRALSSTLALTNGWDRPVLASNLRSRPSRVWSQCSPSSQRAWPPNPKPPRPPRPPPPPRRERDRPRGSLVLGERLGAGREQGDGLGQPYHGEVAPDFQSRVEEVPGGEAVLRAGLEQADRQRAQRLGRLHHQGAGRHEPCRLLAADLQLDGLMALEPPRRLLDRVDLVGFEVELDVLAELLDFQPVPLEGRHGFAERRRDQVGEGTGDRFGRLELVDQLRPCSPWSHRS